MRRSDGLTIIELVIALAILGLLLAAIVGPITSTFQLATQSNQTLSGTTQVQRIVERFKATNGVNWDRNCVPLEAGESSFPPAGITTQIQYLNTDASPNTPAGTTTVVGNANCAGLGVGAAATLKRLTVTFTQNTRQIARVVVDVPRPSF